MAPNDELKRIESFGRLRVLKARAFAALEVGSVTGRVKPHLPQLYQALAANAVGPDEQRWLQLGGCPSTFIMIDSGTDPRAPLDQIERGIASAERYLEELRMLPAPAAAKKAVAEKPAESTTFVGVRDAATAGRVLEARRAAGLPDVEDIGLEQIMADVRTRDSEQRAAAALASVSDYSECKTEADALAVHLEARGGGSPDDRRRLARLRALEAMRGEQG